MAVEAGNNNLANLRVLQQSLRRFSKHNRFDSSDFEIVDEQKSSSVSLTINYTIEPKYKIIFILPSGTTEDKEGFSSSYYNFSGTVCPGPLSYNERFNFRGENGIYEQITTWLNCIWEEISSNPVVKK